MKYLAFAGLVVALVVNPASAQKDGPPKKDDFDGLKALKHPDPDVRYNSAQLLADLGPVGKFAIAALQEALKEDKSMVVRVKVAEALWKISKPPARDLLPTLLEALKDSSEVARGSACNVMGQFGAAAKPAVGAIAKALDDPTFSVRAEAALALGEIGPAAKAAVPALLATLKTDNVVLLEPFVLGTLGKIGEDAVPHLIDALEAKELRLRRGAAYALGLIGPPAVDAVPPLTKLLGTSEPALRAMGAFALGRIGKDAKSASPTLKKQLDDAEVPCRLNAAVALWFIEQDKSGAAVLVKALKDANVNVREAGCKACAEVATSPMLPLGPLADCLDDQAAVVKMLAAEALGKAGKAAQPVVAELRRLFKDADGQVRVSAALAVWRVEGPGKDVVLLLVKCLSEKSNLTRRAAANALGEMGTAALSAFEALLESYREDTSVSVRRAASAALKKIDAKAAQKAGVR